MDRLLATIDRTARAGHDGYLQVATVRNTIGRTPSTRLTFIAEDPGSNPSGSPTLYRTDRDSWVVQGLVVNDPDTLAQMDIPEGESCVEIPDRLVPFFRQGDSDLDRR